jgi:hypothetical protein
MLLSVMLASALAAQTEIRQCLDAQGRLIYQDQPCMGALRRADIDAPMVQPAWRAAASGCRLRSPLLQIAVTPPLLDAQAPSETSPSPTATFSTQALVQPPSRLDDDDDPATIGLWLELTGTSDGVAIYIRGFQPLPPSAISFDTNISGQGIRDDAGAMIEVDSLDGPGSLRYGYRKSAIMLRRLSGPVATLDVRIPGWQAQTARLDTTELKDAVQRIKDCVRGSAAVRQRRRPGS